MAEETSQIATLRHALWRHGYIQVLVAILIGLLVGYFWPSVGVALKPLGDGFVKLVRMIIAPVIFLTIVGGIARMGELGALGRIVAKAFAYFLCLSTFALIVGLLVGNLIQPGAGLHIDPATLDVARSRITLPRRMTRASPASCSRSSQQPCLARSPRAKYCRCYSSRS